MAATFTAGLALGLRINVRRTVTRLLAIDYAMTPRSAMLLCRAVGLLRGAGSLLPAEQQPAVGRWLADYELDRAAARVAVGQYWRHREDAGPRR